MSLRHRNHESGRIRAACYFFAFAGFFLAAFVIVFFGELSTATLTLWNDDSGPVVGFPPLTYTVMESDAGQTSYVAVHLAPPAVSGKPGSLHGEHLIPRFRRHGLAVG